VSGSRLDIGWLTGGRIAVLLPSLVRYLARGGCDGLAYPLVDFDDVRGD
jgi:hypothetical protein